VIYVGDAHQQIYAWRGAVNAMQQLPLPESRLTTSFRFGEQMPMLPTIY
jgi:L-asparaginase II